MFLMHRVELKGMFNENVLEMNNVPNAPCGVESSHVLSELAFHLCVPNAPCGVERTQCKYRLCVC